MSVSIRSARADEADALSALALRSKAHWGYDAAFIEACRPLLTVTTEIIRRGMAWVAEREAQAVGFYTLVKQKDAIEIDMLFIEPDAIGEGVGSSLFAHAVIQAHRLGISRLIVEADPNAVGFYVAMGMKEYATRESSIEKGRMLPLMEMLLNAPPHRPAKQNLIYHLSAQTDWERGKKWGQYSAPSLASEGFIHFSTAAQVAGTANRYYAGRQDILLLEVDPDRVQTRLVYEPPKAADRADQLFPHLYGVLNLDAVLRVIPYLPDSSGTFRPPKLLD